VRDHDALRQLDAKRTTRPPATRLRAVRSGDEAALLRIHRSPEVRRWWGDPAPGFPWGDDPEAIRLVIDVNGAVAGLVQFSEELEPRYRHATVDVFLDPSLHGRGLGTAVLRRLLAHLFEDRGHHRVTIDPAAANTAAIRCYEKAGFRPVGLMRQYEREPDSDQWHDGLLMEALANEMPASPVPDVVVLLEGGMDSQPNGCAA
jgi:aminoglycoside 6'-N-acetyltransferase